MIGPQRDVTRTSLRLRAGLCALAAAALLPWTPLAAQQDRAEEPGRIQGRVVSAEDGSPVTTARIELRDTDAGTLSDMDGRYFLRRVEPGTYTLVVGSIGFAQKAVTGVTVEPGETTRLDVSLEPRAVQMTEITVSVDRERGSTAALLDEQRTADAVSDVVGQEQLSRRPDSDAAQAARRMTGVTVSDGKYVYVRGLGKRYSQTSLNGSPLPSPNPEQSTVPLDLFPAGFLESLTTQKTYTPDEPGDFSGGNVEIETREYPDRFRMNVSIGTSLNTESQFAKGFLSYAGGGLDFLGFDDGSRSLPAAVEGELGGQRLPGDPATVERIGESFLGDLSTFAPTSGTTPANLDASFSMGDRTSLFGEDFGYFVAATYQNSYRFRDDEVERKWRASNFDPSVPEDRRNSANVDYSFVRGIQEVDWGAVGNFSFLFSPRHEITLKTLYNRNAEDEARTFTGANREDLGGILNGQRLRFVARSLAWGQLGGDHQILDGHRVEWRLSAARASRDEPGLRETIYRRGFSAPSDDPFTLVDTGESARYLFSELDDDDLNGGLDWSLPVPWYGEGSSRLKVGGMVRTRHRDFSARRFRWDFAEGSGITSLDSALNEGSVVGRVGGPGEFALQEIVEPGDDYTVDDDTYAGYAMLDVPLLPSLRAVMGARLESYDLALDAVGGDRNDSRLSATDVLPAANLTWAVSPEMNLRAAASRTLDRPEFRELAPFQFTQAASLRQLFGNPNLEIAEISNYDLRWEWFPSAGELVSASLFYKEMDRPIEQVFASAASSAYTYQNAENAHLYGLELGLRKRLSFVADAFEPLIFEGNLTLIESEVQVRTGGIFNPTNLRRELEGQAPYVVNLGLTYAAPDGPEASVLFNVSGDRIVAAGGAGVPDIVEQARPQLDLSYRQPLWNRFSLELQAENLLDAEHRWEQSANGITHVQRSYHEGQSISASLSVAR